MERRSRFPLRRRALALGLAAAFGLASVDASAHAPQQGLGFLPNWLDRAARPSGTIIVVENCNDSGPGSLRDAIANASGDTVIDLDSLACSTITLTTGALVIDPPGTPTMTLSRSATYNNPYYVGIKEPTLDVSASHLSRVIDHHGAGALYIEGIELSDGTYAGTQGGCVYSNGPLFLDGVAVVSCDLDAPGSSDALGGGIYAKGALNMNFSQVSGARARSVSGYTYGGGIFSAYALGLFYSKVETNIAYGFGYGGGIAARGRVLIEASLVDTNQAQYDGGLALFGGSTIAHALEIADSTVTLNTAQGNVGGIEADAELYLYNSTIAFNSGGANRAGGVVLNGASVLSMYSTIVARNTSGGKYSDISGASTIVGSHNLVIASSTTLPGDTIIADPALGPLQNNGGQTHTMALLAGSPAINAGNNILNEVCDQRSGNFSYYDGFIVKYPRVVGTNADIGAFETGADDEIFPNGFDGPPLLPQHCFRR